MAVVAWLVTAPVVVAQFAQQGPKLVANDPAGNQGFCEALSADGNTAIVGGHAAFVWTRSGGIWSQQGTSLLANDAVGLTSEGFAVALSSDGNTAIIGEGSDNTGQGAAWVWTRSGGVWTQQGPKLVGSGGILFSTQGDAVALSADGNTAMIGGRGDNNGVGAVWFWTRSGGVWTQQGPKLVGSGTVGNSQLGTSVALSADGNTAIAGGDIDNGAIGAAWVWTRSGGVWTQQGPKLVGSGGVGQSGQGVSIALSADGNTAMIGSYFDDSFKGAAWVWTRSAGVWTQQGSKLVAAGSTAGTAHGRSVALSSDGNTALIGGFGDSGNVGAAWVWTRSGAVWTQVQKLVGSGSVGSSDQGISVAIAADAKTAMVGGFLDDSSHGAVWPFVASSGLSIVKTPSIGSSVNTGQTFAYLLAVTNAGPSAATNVTVTDVLPPGLTFFAVNPAADWSCGQAAGTVTCTAASLPVGQAPLISIVVAAPPNAATITNTATVSSATADPDLTDNSSTSSVTVVAPADLAIFKTTATTLAFGMTLVTYTLAVTNAGPGAASNVTVTDFLPMGCLFLNASGAGWTCGAVPNGVVCTRPSLAVGPAPPILLAINAPNTLFETTMQNTALVASTTLDPATGNNNSSSVVPLFPPSEIPAFGGDALALLAGALAAIGLIAASRRC